MQNDRGSIPMGDVRGCNSILSIGHVLVDVFGRVESFPISLEPTGPYSLHIEHTAMAAILSEIYRRAQDGTAQISSNLGGGAAVVSIISSTLGVATTFMGCTGKDPQGDFIAKKLHAAGVDFLSVNSPKPSGIFLSLIDRDRKRLIRVTPSAARDVRGVKVEDSELQEGSILYIDGLLIDAYAWLSDIARRAKTRRMTVAMDFSTPGNALENAPQLHRFSQEYCDIVFANALEKEAVYGSGGIANLKDDLVFVEKRGKDGALLRHSGKAVHLPAPCVPMREDTCAGDALAAGFMKAFIEGRTPRECLNVGMSAAAVALQSEGSGFTSDSMRTAVAGKLNSL